MDDFLKLESKIERVAEELRLAREARLRAEQETHAWKTRLGELKENFNRLEKEVIALRKEREEVQQRVQKIMGLVDALA